VAQYETSLAAPEPQTTRDSSESVTDDRRRAGRPDHVNPTLVPLLRGDLPSSLPPSDETDLAQDRGKLAPAAAIAVISLLSTLLWAAIGFIWWAVVY